jgi:hypothetical protein
MDRRIRFLTKRLEIAEVVDPTVHPAGVVAIEVLRVAYPTQQA